MNNTVSLTLENPSRINLNWAIQVLFRPRRAFAAIAKQSGSTWLTPLLILTLTAVLQVVVAGPIKQQAALAGQDILPPDFQYYPPEMQAQFQQAMAATQSPVFIYVFPILTSMAGVWIGWLLVGGLVHLALTLLGGRGATNAAMNLVAWASLPFAVRDSVRIIAILGTHRLIENPGLSGFAPPGSKELTIFLVSLLALIDIYVVWHVALIVIGVRASDGLASTKIVGGVLFVILLMLSIQALLHYLVARLGNLTIVRPFF